MFTLDVMDATPAQIDVALKAYVPLFDKGGADLNPINAIKEVREAVHAETGTTFSLRAAKHLIDLLRDVYHKGQGNAAKSENMVELTSSQAAALRDRAACTSSTVEEQSKTLLQNGLDGLDIGHCRVCAKVSYLSNHGYCRTCPQRDRY